MNLNKLYLYCRCTSLYIYIVIIFSLYMKRIKTYIRLTMTQNRELALIIIERENYLIK